MFVTLSHERNALLQIRKLLHHHAETVAVEMREAAVALKPWAVSAWGMGHGAWGMGLGAWWGMHGTRGSMHDQEQGLGHVGEGGNLFDLRA
jgi:hypothetical protein